jgi:UDP-N-acetylmuramate--alanine ligase
LGVSPYVVAEADESDGSFLKLPSTYVVITNIDSDHLDHYSSLSKIDDAFVEFVNHLPFYGQAWVCGDDPGVQRCLPRFSKPFKTYGFGENCDLRAESYRNQGLGSETQLSDGTVIRLSVPGKHNALNALAALGICQDLGIETHQIVQAIEHFYGVKRRFEIKWRSDQNQIVVDDYAHHPAEIRATLAAARSYFKDGKIKVVFQPHRYSRTLHCLEGFKSAFLDADEVWITPIYAAGESPVVGLDHHTVVAAVKETARSGQKIAATDTTEDVIEKMRSQFSKNEMILFMGAGSITRIADEFVCRL